MGVSSLSLQRSMKILAIASMIVSLLRISIWSFILANYLMNETKNSTNSVDNLNAWTIKETTLIEIHTEPTTGRMMTTLSSTIRTTSNTTSISTTSKSTTTTTTSTTTPSTTTTKSMFPSTSKPTTSPFQTRNAESTERGNPVFIEDLESIESVDEASDPENKLINMEHLYTPITMPTIPSTIPTSSSTKKRKKSKRPKKTTIATTSNDMFRDQRFMDSNSDELDYHDETVLKRFKRHAIQKVQTFVPDLKKVITYSLAIFSGFISLILARTLFMAADKKNYKKTKRWLKGTSILMGACAIEIAYFSYMYATSSSLGLFCSIFNFLFNVFSLFLVYNYLQLLAVTQPRVSLRNEIEFQPTFQGCISRQTQS